MRNESKNKKIHNRSRLKNPWTNSPDKYNLGKKGSWVCPICGSNMEFYKYDRYGDFVMSCVNMGCKNSKDYVGTVNYNLGKLMKELQLSARYYTDYMGGYKGEFHNPWRKVPYMDKDYKEGSVV